MSFFSKLFGKEISKVATEQTESQKNIWDGYDSFQAAKEYYFDRKATVALFYFDEAFDHEFLENFPENGSEFYDLRGACLQELGYDYDAIEDFNKSIEFSPEDCNKYFSRSLSKGAIFDYGDEVADLKKAIELSKIVNTLNEEYSVEARKQGYKDAASMFEARLRIAEMRLERDIQNKKRIEDASTIEQKQFWQKIYDEERTKQLSQIKRRT